MPQAGEAADRVHELVAAAERDPAEALVLLGRRAAAQRATLKPPAP